MAKNNHLFRFFLCLGAGLCIGIGGVVVGVRYWVLGDRVNGIDGFQQSTISCQLVSEESGEQSTINQPKLDLRSLRWPCVLGASSVSLDSSSTITEVKSDCHPIPSVILSGTQWSRKISPLEAEPVRLAKSPFCAFNQQIYSSVSCFGHSLTFRSSPFRYAPVEKTAVQGLAFEVTLLNANLIRNEIKQIYSAEIGVREKTGKNDGERVEEYLAVTQLGKGYAWCAAFVSWVFSEAGFPEPRTPWSPTLFPKKRVIWDRGKNLKANTQSITPKPADVFGIYFANLKRIAHVGFVDEWGEKQIITVEGNTNEAGSAEGDGVYRKRRPIASIYQVANWIDLEVEP